MNRLGKESEPFFFMFDFELEKSIVKPLFAVDNTVLKYSMNDGFVDFRNYTEQFLPLPQSILLEKELPSFEQYQKAFDLVHQHLVYGNSFLTNLTVETPIHSNYDFHSLFQYAKAKYKLFVRDHFMCFSPESFVQIKPSGIISSFPMKGTIEASVENAAEVILANEKERYEHTTIVDLIRNDLSSVCQKVWVERFRYIESIQREDKSELLQVSSEVCGDLGPEWLSAIGDTFSKLLPAGSISGAPKQKTIEIIKEAEHHTYRDGARGFYTGVFGVFDGQKLDSAVMIRFIENTDEGLIFKSGGGITARSEVNYEYAELISKIYVPIF